MAEEIVRTAGAPHHIRLLADRLAQATDSPALAYVTARVEDQAGTLCPEATTQLRFKVDGAGRFRAAANGNAASLEPFWEPRMKAFPGQLVILVQTTQRAGDLRREVAGEGWPRPRCT